MNLPQSCPACGSGPVNIVHDRGDELEVVCLSCQHTWTHKRVKVVRARVIQDDCEECRNELLEEARSLGGLPLSGEVVLIPEHWLDAACVHGRLGLRFELDEAAGSASQLEASARESDEDLGTQHPDRAMDATRNIGYPVREHGPYGSHPMHDGFNDESDADGPGTYSGLRD